MLTRCFYKHVHGYRKKESHTDIQAACRIHQQRFVSSCQDRLVTKNYSFHESELIHLSEAEDNQLRHCIHPHSQWFHRNVDYNLSKLGSLFDYNKRSWYLLSMQPPASQLNMVLGSQVQLNSSSLFKQSMRPLHLKIVRNLVSYNFDLIKLSVHTANSRECIAY